MNQSLIHSNTDREDLEKESVEKRITHFNEFYYPPTAEYLKKQSSRCLDCGVPLCQSNTINNNGCPVQNLIPDWNELVQKCEWKKASDLLHSTNNFPEFTGKLCPAPCESVCILGINDKSVSIRNIESSIVERGFQEGWITSQISTHKTGFKIAVIGSGPAGLAAAQQLTRLGHSITVFEKADQIGGLLRFGIPDFKLDKKILDRRLNQMISEGTIFETNCEIGKNINLVKLKKDFNAICLTTGAEKPRDLNIKGRNLKSIYFAMDYLIAQNKVHNQNKSSISAESKNVIILGGGDTGSDCLGTAIRQGCKKAYQIELLPKPISERKISHSSEENSILGGEQLYATSTIEFIGNEKGEVCGLRTQEVEFQNGVLQLIPHSEKIIEAEMVLLAMGFTGTNTNNFKDLPFEFTNRDTIQVNKNYETNIKGIFAAGDLKRGASLIVWAIAEGRAMAEKCHEYVNSL